jgi:hypothetical protein
MNVDFLGFLAAAAGGFLGATFGALVAFVFTGFAVIAGVASLIGSGDPAFLNNVAFGAFFGPQISFAAGVGAVAYAAKRGWVTSGKDIVTPMVSLSHPSVLLVGAGFGIYGYLVQNLIALIPWFGSNTDSVALTVIISALTARLVFGKTGIIGTLTSSAKGWKRFAPDAEHAWIPYQQSPAMASLLGLFVGGLSAWSSVTLLAAYPEASGVIYLGFGFSAVSLLFLAFNVAVPATHHITLVSAVAASGFLLQVGLAPWQAVLVGAVFGMVSALVGEFFSRLWLIRGDTHIDPPASAIWPMTTLALVCISIFAR